MPLKTFENLPETERTAIIDVCMSEFATQGFKNASTNNIVKKLGIPKGSIFYWFGNKDNLYLFLIDITVNHFVAELAGATQKWPNEILARLRIIMETSFTFLEKNPNHFRLFMSFMDGEARHLLGPYLQKHWNEGLNVWGSWYTGVDTSDFRSTPEEVQQLLMWVIAGIKVEMYSLVDRENPVESSHLFFMKKLDVVIHLLAHAIYNHPEQWGYS